MCIPRYLNATTAKTDRYHANLMAVIVISKEMVRVKTSGHLIRWIGQIQCLFEIGALPGFKNSSTRISKFLNTVYATIFRFHK